MSIASARLTDLAIEARDTHLAATAAHENMLRCEVALNEAKDDRTEAMRKADAARNALFDYVNGGGT